jgi:hypothetical protein
MSLKFAFVATIVFGFFLPISSTLLADSSQRAAAARAQAKLQHIEKSAGIAHPDRTPTEITEQEVNAYFAAGKVKLPAGVESVTFRAQPGVITASCRVDFDQVKAGSHSSNPLLSLFSGVHDVVVVANASGAAGQGLVDVQSVSLDGVEVPQFLLEIFVEKYLTPKYPNVGLESRFRLSDKIDTAIVGEHNLIVIQK